MSRYLFPRWTNQLPTLIALGAGLFGILAVSGFWYYGTEKFWNVGYQPAQPVEYSHKLHAGDLGMDCRYCHYTVERSSFAAVPPTQVCMNCHSKVRTDSQLLLPVRESWASGLPIPWVKVHNLPDYVYFDHSAHLNGGVGCSTCHGRVDQAPRITQEKPLTMGWCLECHRDPTSHIRPAGVSPTDMTWSPTAESIATAKGLLEWQGDNRPALNPPTHCSACHR